jgi:polysaccharide export outer membrane protein
VSDSGFIKIPLVGFLKVGDLNLLQVEALLEDSLASYFKNLAVDVKLMSFRISFIGEVFNQGTFTVFNNEINILQGLGLAGGLTDVADRTRIRVVRKEKDKSKLYYVNLHSTDIVNSNVYYLKPNDVIYVEPLKAKTIRVNSTTITAALSILTFTIVLINFASKK